MEESHPVMVCGVDCIPNDRNCNGYCQGSCDYPPPATAELIRCRARIRAIQSLRQSVDLWRSYVSQCPTSSESVFANELLDALMDVERRLPLIP